MVKTIMSFPLKQRRINGYKFGSPTWYSNFHLGTDYGFKNDEIFAPFNGFVKTAVGKEGGNTLYFYPEFKKEMIRFLHLKEFKKTGVVKKGDLIGIVGKTGKTTKEETHTDISMNGILELKNRANFIDPEKYDWNWDIAAETTSLNISLQLVLNQPLWPSLLGKMAKLQDWFYKASDKRIWLQIENPIKTPLFGWPYLIYPFPNWAKVIDERWYNRYVMPFSKSNITAFVMSNRSWDSFGADGRELQGFTYPTLPVRIGIAVDENEKSLVPAYKDDDAFFVYLRHELAHGLSKLGQPSGFDFVHKYEAEGSIEKVFDTLNYEFLKKNLDENKS